MAPKPFAGIRVVELGHSVAAPFAGFILAELGADVIKVESPDGGDDARKWGPPFFDGSAPHFVALNRNKRSVTVKLSDPHERARLKQLIIKTADVVISNLRPGSLSKLGLGAEHLLAEKPELILSEIGAFGRPGPMSESPGYDPLMQAYGGIMSITGEDESRPPIRVGVSIVDMGAGFWSVIGIISALFERKRSGHGAAVETSLFETALAWTMIQVASVIIEPRQLSPQGSGASGIVPYQAFLASDGWIMIAAGNDGLFRKLVESIGQPQLAVDPRFQTNALRVENRRALIAILDDALAHLSVAAIRSMLDQAGVPNAPVQRIDHLPEDPQVQALGILQAGPEGALPTIGLPLSFNRERPAYHRPAPTLGEHTDEVFAVLRDPPESSPIVEQA